MFWNKRCKSCGKLYRKKLLTCSYCAENEKKHLRLTTRLAIAIGAFVACAIAIIALTPSPPLTPTSVPDGKTPTSQSPPLTPTSMPNAKTPTSQLPNHNLKEEKNCIKGPRGGLYVVTPSGSKDYSACSKDSHKSKKEKELIKGPRGGTYYITESGSKVYVPREKYRE